MMGWYYAKELAKTAEVKLAGPEFAGAKSDFALRPGAPLQPVLDRLGSWPDFYVEFYSKPGYHPADLPALKIPKAWYIYDTHLHLDELCTASYLFDLVFCPSEADRQRLLARGVPRVEVLEFAADPDMYFRPIEETRPKKLCLGFAGSARGHAQLKGREEFLRRVAERYPLHIEHRTLQGGPVADFYRDCDIVLNHAIGGELNMRVPEALMSGSALLTPEVEGLTDFIDTQRSLAIFNGDNVFEKIETLLARPDLRLELARHGQQEVLAKHTYAHRAQKLVACLEEHRRQGFPSKNPWLLEAAQLRYTMFRHPGSGVEMLSRPVLLPPGLAGRGLGLFTRLWAKKLRALAKLMGKKSLFEDLAE